MKYLIILEILCSRRKGKEMVPKHKGSGGRESRQRIRRITESREIAFRGPALTLVLPGSGLSPFP